MTVGPRTAFEAMNLFLEQHRIQPVIACVHAFEGAQDAFQQLDKGAFGKIVIGAAGQG